MSSRGNIKMALASVRSTRWRSFLTMLGIIIGIVSVISVVSIGEGVKNQVNGQINQLGRDLITIRPGQLVSHNGSGAVSGLNLLTSGPNTVGTLSQQDLQTVSSTQGVKQTVPLGLVSGNVTASGKTYTPLILATTSDLPAIIHQGFAGGGFFPADVSSQPNVAVIGSGIAQQLFGQTAPLGESFNFMGQIFFIQGIFKQFDTNPLSLSTDFNNSIFIPYSTAQVLTNNNTQLYQILAKPRNPNQVDSVAGSINANLKAAHQGQQQFTVLRQGDSLAVTNNILNLLTRLIVGIAAISLLVGGVGIMDVMLVSVAERMHEIGIRKALGATNRQILLQFLTESSVLSFVGGIIGILLSLLVAFIIGSFTTITPVVTWQIVVIAAVVSLLIGIVFGSAPALKAARKDPINALRND